MLAIGKNIFAKYKWLLINEPVKTKGLTSLTLSSGADTLV